MSVVTKTHTFANGDTIDTTDVTIRDEEGLEYDVTVALDIGFETFLDAEHERFDDRVYFYAQSIPKVGDHLSEDTVIALDELA
jgi:hypothetical protein